MESSKVFVFPCVSRDTGEEQKNLDAKLMSEKNITNIIKSITDNKSYVISWDDGLLKCVIDGYYFEVMGAPTGNQYAFIGMNNGVIKGDNGVDEDSKYFEGLTIADTKPESEEYLILCENGVVPDSSKLKFDISSIFQTGFFDIVDCGELN